MERTGCEPATLVFRIALVEAWEAVRRFSFRQEHSILHAALRHTSPTTGFQFYVTVDQQAATKTLSPIQKFGSGFGYI
jgi:hypothetical protein